MVTVRAFDAAQRPLAGAAVEVRNNGLVDGTAVTDENGRALLSLSLPLGSAEYQAASATAESNTVFTDR